MFNNKLEVIAQIPQGNFSVYKNGVLEKNLVEFEFFADVNKIPYFNATYGIENKNFKSREYKESNMELKIISNGGASDTYIYINNIRQERIQKVYLKCDSNNNELKITSYF